MLGRRNSGQLPPVKELKLPLRKNSENLANNLEKQVICPKEGNSNNLEPAQDDIEVAPPCQEREGNPEIIHEQEEAEPCETRDLPTISLDGGVEGGVVDGPQRVRRPPAWFGDFITGGELEQSFAESRSNNTQLSATVNMAQQQLEQPLELMDMWSPSDDEERQEKRLPGEGLDISWLAPTTKRKISDRFYEATAQEGKCSIENCEYTTLSRRKLLDHLVTLFIVYVTDCNYMTSRRDSAVKHLRTCHNRLGSITQTDESSWRRLRDINPHLPTNCPPLPMTAYQYRTVSRCQKERTTASLPISVKRIRTVDNSIEPNKVEQPPIVKVEKRVEIRRRLSRLREDYQAVERIRKHLEEDMAKLERQLGKKSRHQ